MKLIIFFIAAAAASNQIVTNHPLCTDIAVQLLKKGASVFELFIAASVCEGVVHPQDSGLGGGFQAVYFNGSCKEAPTVYFNSREKSPKRWTNIKKVRREAHHQIGVPSMLKGYERLYTYDRCGYKPTLEWKSLFEKSAELASSGFPLSRTVFDVLSYIEHLNGVIFIDSHGIARNNRLSKFLSYVALEGPKSSMYKPGGFLQKLAVKELKYLGSDLRGVDFKNYTTLVQQPTKCTFRGMNVTSTRFPGSGKCICFALKLLTSIDNHVNITSLSMTKRQLVQIQMLRYTYLIQPYIQRFKMGTISAQIKKITRAIIEDIKHEQTGLDVSALATFGSLRLTNQTFVNPYGTSNIVIKVGNEMMSATSSVNWSFGSKHYSKTMGIFYNNQLADFSNDKSSRNYPKPNAYPQSSMSGTVMSIGQTPVFSIGAAGGRKIVGSILTTIFNYFYNGKTLENAVAAARCIPIREILYCESHIEPSVRANFNGWNIEWTREAGYSAVTAMTSLNNKSESVFDPRRGGSGYVD